MTEGGAPIYKQWWFLLLGAVVLLIGGIGVGMTLTGGSDDTINASDTSTTVVADEGTTTTTQVPTTTTTQVPTTTTTTVPDSDVVKEWIEALADSEYARAESLSTMWAGQAMHYLNVFNRLEPGGLENGLTDIDYSDTSVTWTFEGGDEITYDNASAVDGKVAEFDADGLPISSIVNAEPGEAAEVGGVTVTVTVAYHVENPTYGTVSTLTIEVDNQSDEEIYGWDAVLVGSDARAVEVETTASGSYAPGAISDDVLQFLGADLSEGGELRISVDYDTFVAAPVPPIG